MNADEIIVDPRIAANVIAYADEQGFTGVRRAVTIPDPPYPELENVMLEYLVYVANEMFKTNGAAEAIVWVAVNAWFEGGWAERARSLA